MEADKEARREHERAAEAESGGAKAESPAITLWLDVLSNVLPPTGVLLIGAGAGRSAWVQWLKGSSALNGIPVHLVEGDEQQHRYLQRSFAGFSGFELRRDVVAPNDGPATFHLASNASESGLIPANKLRTLWSNLRIRDTVQVATARSLDTLNEKAGGVVNWLLIDCLPAAALLEGGRRLLPQLDVAVVRIAHDLPEVAKAGQQATDAAMDRVGLRRVHSQVERHPALAHVVYVRDAARLSLELLTTREKARLDAESAASELKASQARWAKEKAQLTETYRRETKREDAPRSVNQGNADIDDFLDDIAPFLYGRSITYVDVGAFIGEILAKMSSHGKVRVREAHLFEPNPESCERLEENIRGLKVSKVRVYNHALASKESTLTFSSEKSMTKVVPEAARLADQSGSFTSDSKRLDDLAGNFTDRRIDLLKIDVEGFELEVIDGAEELLREQRVDIVYIEVGFNKAGTQQSYFGAIDARLQGLGYRVFKIYEQTSEWIVDSPLLRRCNFAYMSEKFAASNPLKVRKELVELKREVARLKGEGS